MPIPGNLTVIGPEGSIEGSCEIEGREGSILVQAFNHTVEIPTDREGITSGRRRHRPLTITKEIDRSTPMFYQALCLGEKLNEAKLDWYRINETGAQELYFSIKMEHVMVSKIHPWVPNVLDEANKGFRHMEDVSFTYEKITWVWELDGIEFEDQWGEMLESS